MADYYTDTELSALRNRLAGWIGVTANSIVNDLKFAGSTCSCKKSNLSLMVSYLEVLECYVSVNDTTDGEDNCITEAQVDNMVSNIMEVTKMCFAPKGSALEDPRLPDEPNETFNILGDSPLVLLDGTELQINIKTKYQA